MALRKLATFHAENDSQIYAIVHRNTALEEFMVKLYIGGSHYTPAVYFTQDRCDAFATAVKLVAKAETK